MILPISFQSHLKHFIVKNIHTYFMAYSCVKKSSPPTYSARTFSFIQLQAVPFPFTGEILVFIRNSQREREREKQKYVCTFKKLNAMYILRLLYM